MTMTSAAVRTRSRRDSEADVETEIYVRPEGQPMAWDRVMVLQIMKELDSRLPRVVPPPRPRVVITKRRTSRVTPTPPPGEPNVFLTPWTPADPMPPWAVNETVKETVNETVVLEGRPREAEREVRKARTTRIPWLVFVMAFGIAFGIAQDRQLRRELGSTIRGATVHAAAVVAHRVSSPF